MKIDKIYLYPIKSLHPISLPHAVLTNTGFQYDRQFMLLKVVPPLSCSSKKELLKSMHVVEYYQLVLFHITFNEGEDEPSINITYESPDSPQPYETISIPLCPRIEDLKTFDVDMWGSATTGYNMGEKYNSWFSDRLGFKVVLAYTGGNKRDILGSFAPRMAPPSLLGQLSTKMGLSETQEEIDTKVGFADFMPFLVINTKSLDDLSTRLMSGEEVDNKKFRPSIIVSDAEGAWDEDYWAELTFLAEDEDDDSSKGDIVMPLTHNCVRCVSLNVDYRTGVTGEGESGVVLKRLQAERRVDKGAKYSPVFGRYGFVQKGLNRKLVVGQEVEVTKRNKDRTVFDWPGWQF